MSIANVALRNQTRLRLIILIILPAVEFIKLRGIPVVRSRIKRGFAYNSERCRRNDRCASLLTSERVNTTVVRNYRVVKD